MSVPGIIGPHDMPEEMQDWVVAMWKKKKRTDTMSTIEKSDQRAGLRAFMIPNALDGYLWVPLYGYSERLVQDWEGWPITEMVKDSMRKSEGQNGLYRCLRSSFVVARKQISRDRALFAIVQIHNCAHKSTYWLKSARFSGLKSLTEA